MFTEANLEDAIIQDLSDLGYSYSHGDLIPRDCSEVLIVDDLKDYLSSRYSSSGITAGEVDSIIKRLRIDTGSIYEDNRSILTMIRDGFLQKREDRSKKDLFIDLIDYDNPQNNKLRIVNQFKIQGPIEKRIPDAIIFINGIPLVVFEFKSAIREDATLSNAYDQLTTRYKRDIPSLFRYNAFLVISDGVNSRYGTLFSNYKFFYSWPKVDAEDEAVDGIDSLTTMLKGMFRQDRLLSIIHNFIHFPECKVGTDKIVCRYPQFFAAIALHENIKIHLRPEGDGKGGTYFGSTGCGKSFTMLFLTRLLVLDSQLRNPTIVLITDRTDLDSQLSDQFLNSKTFLRDENVRNIGSRQELKDALKGCTSGGVFLTTIQKFSEDVDLLSDRSNIICISDEAHRSQLNLEQQIKIEGDELVRKYGFAKYLHDSLPNATYVGFTGTPIDETLEVFGDIVDKYTMVQSVKDGITVDLVYEGRAAKVNLNNDRVVLIEEYYIECDRIGTNGYQIEESKRTVSRLNVILGDPSRLSKVADDFIRHYEKRVEEGSTVAGKALFVCADRHIAFDFYKLLIERRPEWAFVKGCMDPTVPEEERKKVPPMAKLRMVMTRSKDDEEELYNLLGTKEDREELDRNFKNINSNFKIAIVVDMWLTGFDVPFLDTIYIDKPIQKHTLIQTISRVNRVYEGKTSGLIVDYIGIKKELNLALNKYTDFERDMFDDVDESAIVVRDKLEVLAGIMHGFDSSDFFSDDSRKQLQCLNRASEFVQRTKEREDRFMSNVSDLRSAYNLCSGSDLISESEKDLIHFYMAIRSVIKKTTKGDTPDTSEMNEHVRKLVQDAIESDEVVQLFDKGVDTEHATIDIFSDAYLEGISRIPFINTKIKTLQRLLTQAIHSYGAVNRKKSLEFSDRLKAIVDKYNARREDAEFTAQILEDLVDLIMDMKADKESSEAMGMSFEEKAFYDIITYTTDKYQFNYPDDKTRELAKEIKDVVENKMGDLDWYKRDDSKAALKVEIILLMEKYGYPPVTIEDVYRDVLEQAENYKKNLSQN